MLATTLTWNYAFFTELVVIDVLAVGVLAAIHAAANWNLKPLSNTPTDRAQSFGLVQTLASSSVTVVGILLPLSLAAIATFAARHAGTRVLANVFIGDCWLALSLAMGLFALWLAGFRGHTENVQNIRAIRLLNGWQLLILFAGIFRLLVATYFLVQTAH